MSDLITGEAGLVIAFTAGNTLHISRKWAKAAGIKTIKIAEGAYGRQEHRI